LIEKYGCPDLINHPNLADKDNCLHQACDWGRSKVVEALLAKGADPNSTGKYDNTGLHFAVDESSLSCCQLLVKAGADANKQSTSGVTCLDKAVPYKQEIGEYLYSIGSRCNKNPYPSSWKQ